MNGPSYCTLFNFAYLSRGLVLYESLTRVHSEFCLYIFAFDDLTREVLLSMKLEKAVIISLEEFEDEELRKVKPQRTSGEYCWTCTPSTIKYAIEKFNLPYCIYLDADLCFYSSPLPILEELSFSSVGLTPHNYSHEYNLAMASGKYCVQFVYVRNTPQGREPLEWWRRECITSCSRYAEDGKYGDQKYLDSMPAMYREVHDITLQGAGIAPWNILRFNFFTKDGQIFLKSGDHEEKVIFYHFQKLRIDLAKKIIRLGKWYDFNDEVIGLFYKPYIERILYYENMVGGTAFKITDFKIIKSGRAGLFFFYTVQRVLGRSLFVRRLYNRINIILDKIMPFLV